jgi:hypothetical protein
VFNKSGKDGRTIADDYAEQGYKLEPANVDRINGAAEILTRFGDPDRLDDDGNPDPIPPRALISSRCSQLIDCIPSMEHDPHRAEDVRKVDCDEEGIGGDDWYDGYRYGVMACYRTAPEKPAYRPMFGAASVHR